MKENFKRREGHEIRWGSDKTRSKIFFWQVLGRGAVPSHAARPGLAIGQRRQGASGGGASFDTFVLMNQLFSCTLAQPTFAGILTLPFAGGGGGLGSYHVLNLLKAGEQAGVGGIVFNVSDWFQTWFKPV